MNPDPLRIISTDRKPQRSLPKSSRREELQARLERQWKNEPQSFDPMCNWFERLRIQRTLELIQKLSFKRVADLGCGQGTLSDKLAQSEVRADAVDIASLALERVNELHNPAITPLQDYVPHTQLKDQTYDLVLACELIGYLYPEEQRLFFSEVARIVTPEGHILVSTRLDINSSDALKQFAELAETELLIKEWKLSYHHLAIRLIDCFKAPQRFFKGSQSADYRKTALSKRFSLSRYWYQFNSSQLMRFIWRPIAWLTTPFAAWLEQRGAFLALLEKLSSMLWQEGGATHALILAQRRPLTSVKLPPLNERPVEHKGKRFVWE